MRRGKLMDNVALLVVVLLLAALISPFAYVTVDSGAASEPEAAQEVRGGEGSSTTSPNSSGCSYRVESVTGGVVIEGSAIPEPEALPDPPSISAREGFNGGAGVAKLQQESPGNATWPNQGVLEDVRRLLQSLGSLSSAESSGAASQESPRLLWADDGYLRSLGAPPLQFFQASSMVPGDPQSNARSFLAQHGELFGITSRFVDFMASKVKSDGNRHYVRLQQTYRDVPVFCGEVLVQLNSFGVEYVLSDVMRDTSLLDAGQLSVIPSISAAEAQKAAVALLASEYTDLDIRAADPVLMIYQPSVVGNTGTIRLVWQTTVADAGQALVDELVLVDAHTAEIALHYSQICEARNRQIYDANNAGFDVPGNLVRVEGGPATGIADADLAYDYLGDAYDFYFSNHGRDSVDGNGQTLIAHVQYCSSQIPYPTCPMDGAFWYQGTERLYFGDGWVADDIVGHELTHGVTQHTSGLQPLNEAGAINEAFSDIWGEFIDLTNGRGTDTPAARWLVGEDSESGAIRNMAHPELSSSPLPDKMSSDDWYTGSYQPDLVHTNMGVGIKLAYLLTDDDWFNGYTITGMGIPRVADLFYEVQTHTLQNSGANYEDLHAALVQAAVNLGWTVGERQNLENACRSVEIVHGIIDVEAPTLVVGQWGLVRLDVVAPEPNNYYVKVFDDSGLPLPEWEWASTESDQIYLGRGWSTPITFLVRPDSVVAGFQFWFYEYLGLGFWKIIDKVQIDLVAQEQDTTPPQVVSHRESARKDTSIYVTFSEDMKDSSFTSTSVTVLGSSSGVHSCGLAFSHSALELTIDPSNDFQYGETVSVTIGTGVKDLAGNGLTAPYQFAFPIESAPDPGHTSISVTENLGSSTCNPYDSVRVYGHVQYNDGEPATSCTIDIKYYWDGSWHIWTGSSNAGGDYDRDIVAPGSSGTYTVYVEASDGRLTGTNSQTLNVQSGTGGSNYRFIASVTCKGVDASYNPIDGTVFFRGDDAQVCCWVHLGDVYLNGNTPAITVRWDYFAPDGIRFQNSLYYTIPSPGAGYYYPDYYTWASWYLAGYSMADLEGRWTCKVYIDEGSGYHFVAENAFTVRYEFGEHRMCKDLQDNNPIGETNIFSPEDTRAIAWMRVNNLVDGLDAKWDYYEPSGSLYSSFTLSPPIADPGVGYYYEWAKASGWIWIAGSNAAQMCGDWRVDVFIKDAFGNWDQQYTDHFRIEEHTPPSVSVIAAPSIPVETQNVVVDVSASDNNHLKRIVLHWYDGSDHTQTWDNINASTYTSSHAIGPFSDGQTVEYWAEAWDESENRAESMHRAFVVQQETVSIPDRPSGEQVRQVGQSATYTTGNSTTNTGHAVDYQFDWGDGSQSGWEGTSQTHSWANEGTHLVKSRARCQTHTSRLSDWSSALPVLVDSTGPLVKITTNGGDPFSTAATEVVLEGFSADPDSGSGLESTIVSTGDSDEGTVAVWSFRMALSEGPNVITVTSTDRAGNSGSDTISVTRFTLTNPSPANHATGVSIDSDLSWTGGGPDAGDTVTYDVYFGTNSTPPLVSNNQSGTTYDPGTLAYNTTYYWQIVATDNPGTSATGPLWDFTTDNPPNTPSDPSPANNATGVSINADLSWSGGDPDTGDTVTYDVYFGTNSPPPFEETIGPYPATQLSITYEPGTLTYNIHIIGK